MPKKLKSNQLKLGLYEQYYVDYLKYLFPFEEKALKLTTTHDIGNLIYANVLFCELPEPSFEAEFSIVVELPIINRDDFFKHHFIRFDSFSTERINRFIKVIFNLELENFKLSNLSFYHKDKKELFYTFLEQRNLLNSEGVSIDSLLKKDLRNSKKMLFEK